MKFKAALKKLFAMLTAVLTAFLAISFSSSADASFSIRLADDGGYSPSNSWHELYFVANLPYADLGLPDDNGATNLEGDYTYERCKASGAIKDFFCKDSGMGTSEYVDCLAFFHCICNYFCAIQQLVTLTAPCLVQNLTRFLNIL